MLPLESVPNFSRGPRPGDDRRARRGARRARAAARRARGRRPQPLGLHARRRARTSSSTRCSRGSRCARERIDLRRHEGAHPRIGAADVVPIVPLAPGRHGARARRGADASASGSAASSGCRCSSTASSRRARAGVLPPRRAEELQRRIDAGELAPDFGPARLDPTAGGVIVGARRPLIAFNVNLRGRRRGRRARSRRSCASAAAASPACARSASSCRGPGSCRCHERRGLGGGARCTRSSRGSTREAARARGRGRRLGARRPDARRRGRGRGRGATLADRRLRRLARARAAPPRRLIGDRSCAVVQSGVKCDSNRCWGEAGKYLRFRRSTGGESARDRLGRDRAARLSPATISRVDDVWAVAVDGARPRSSGRRARARCARPARSSSAPRTARSEHTYGVNTASAASSRSRSRRS